MAYGFDPSIILAGITDQQIPTPNETLQTLAQLATHRMQQQQQQATLADLLRRQQREATLADIFRANAETPEALAPALMRGGFGQQAFAAQDQANQNAAREKQLEDVKAAHRKYVGQLFSGVDSQEKWAAAREMLTSEQDPMLAIYASKLPEQFDAAVANRLGSLAGSTTRPLTPEELDARAARAEYERAKAASLGRGPSIADTDRAENLRLRNEKLRKDLGGGPNKLNTIEGYEQDPEFQVKPEVAEKLRTAQAQTRQMTKNVDELMSLYREYGNKVLPSAARARMEAIARHLQLKAKGETMFQLGVIAGPDMDLLNSVIPVPTKKAATIADFFSGGGETSETMERLRVMREQLGDNLHTALTSRGYRPKAKGSNTKAAPGGLTEAEKKELEELSRKYPDIKL